MRVSLDALYVAGGTILVYALGFVHGYLSRRGLLRR
jgi:hypothetical protein